MENDSPAQPAPQPAPEPRLPPWWSDFIVRICELPDRNSPDDEPDAMVATAQELENCALNAIERAALSTPAAADKPQRVDAETVRACLMLLRGLAELNGIRDAPHWQRDIKLIGDTLAALSEGKNDSPPCR